MTYNPNNRRTITSLSELITLNDARKDQHWYHIISLDWLR